MGHPGCSGELHFRSLHEGTVPFTGSMLFCLHPEEVIGNFLCLYDCLYDMHQRPLGESLSFLVPFRSFLQLLSLPSSTAPERPKLQAEGPAQPASLLGDAWSKGSQP